MSDTQTKPTVCVVGGGAAGMMAAGYAASLGAHVILIEKNRNLGKKLAITGKGRCNVTNRCDRDALLSAVTKNSRFLYSAFAAFTPEDTVDFFEDCGVALKTERGNRVFPQSDRAGDIVRALAEYCRDCTRITDRATEIVCENGRVRAVRCEKGIYPCHSVILASGGLSYPLTGSTGDGHHMARSLGHTVTELIPSLVPIESPDGHCREMQGLSLRNVAVKLYGDDKLVYEDFGEMLFTHFGVTGPTVLSMSAHMRQKASYRMTVDLKPALDAAALDARILRDFQKYQNRDFQNALHDLLPQKMIPVVVRLCGIAPDTKVNSVKKEERAKLCRILKEFPVRLSRFRPMDEAIVTSGGVDVTQVSPKTMESKLICGLFFAGELLDVDAYTGGFNLQIAFSTARLASEHAVYRAYENLE